MKNYLDIKIEIVSIILCGLLYHTSATGETGAHQLYNHTEEPCTDLDLRSYIGHDVCEYPDSDKILLTPNGEIFRRSNQYPYFDGETDVDEIWDELKNQKNE